MILSEERQIHFAHLLVDQLWRDDLVDFTDEDMAVRTARRAIGLFIKEFNQMDQKVRESISKLKRGVSEGSPEWDLLYKKYFEEELNRRGKR